jgi:hypothetical protein
MADTATAASVRIPALRYLVPFMIISFKATASDLDPHNLPVQPLLKARRSALTTSACVVRMFTRVPPDSTFRHLSYRSDDVLGLEILQVARRQAQPFGIDSGIVLAQQR